jgi:glycerol-3-phosphate acyltransferase PlsY
MAITVQRKRALFWALGILTALVLMNVAWAQIATAIGHCFSPF